VGIAERADRLVAVLVTTGFVGWFLPEVFLFAVLLLLAVASLITVIQRILYVRKQALSPDHVSVRPGAGPVTEAATDPVSTRDV